MSKVIISLFLGAALLAATGCGWVESADAVPDEKRNAAENAVEEEPEKDLTKIPIDEIESAETALAAGNIYFDRNQNIKAIKAYKKAAKLDPDLAEAHFKLGIAYAIKEAEDEMRPPPVVEPEKEEKKDGKKRSRPEKKNSEIAFENAVTAYKKMVRKDRKNAEAYYNLGRSYNKLNDDKEARKALDRAVRLDPDNSQYQTEYGAIMIKFAKYDQAIRALNKALKIDPANSQAGSLLVRAKAGKKRVDFGAEKLKKLAADRQ